MLAVTLPTGERRGYPEMGRRAAHRESALHAAVLLAVLALSTAVPRTAVRNRLEEAGGATGRTTVDWTAWADVPKEALVPPSAHQLTIFDNYHWGSLKGEGPSDSPHRGRHSAGPWSKPLSPRGDSDCPP